MSKQAAYIIQAFVLVCFLSVMIAAQKAPASTQGAPLKGVDVKLGRAPGGQIASRTTASDGKFDFGVLPVGSYYLTFAVDEKAKWDVPENTNLKPFLILIDGAKGGQIRQAWDAKAGRAFDPFARSASKSEGPEKIAIESDGVHPLTGVCRTVVKSKSNITNN